MVRKLLLILLLWFRASAMMMNNPWTSCTLQMGGQCMEGGCPVGYYSQGGASCGSVHGWYGHCCVRISCSFVGGTCRKKCAPRLETETVLRCPSRGRRCCVTEHDLSLPDPSYTQRRPSPTPLTPRPATARPSVRVTSTTPLLPSSTVPVTADTCGSRNTPVPSELRPTNACDVPWAVSIATTFSGHYCAGVLMSRDRVVTVASCVDTADPRELRLVLGEHDLSRPDPSELRVNVSRVIVHPGYRRDVRGNDIAVLVLAEKLELSRCRQPACFPDGRHLDLANQRCLAAGWGNTDESGPTLLQERRVLVFNSSMCQIILTTIGINQTVTNDVICSIPVDDHTGCTTGGGGLLVCLDDEEVHRITGLVTEYTCQPQVPMLYTDVIGYSAWIRGHMT